MPGVFQGAESKYAVKKPFYLQQIKFQPQFLLQIPESPKNYIIDNSERNSERLHCNVIINNKIIYWCENKRQVRAFTVPAMTGESTLGGCDEKK